MPFGLLVDPPQQLKLPLTRKAWMQGSTEYDVPAAQVLPQGVLVSHNDYIGLYGYDLKNPRWFHKPIGAKGALGIAIGPSGTLLHKPEGSILTQYKIATGEVVRSIETRTKADLVGSSDYNFLLHSIDGKTLTALDWSGVETWQWKYHLYCDFLSTPESYVVVDTGTKLHVLDAPSGKEVWQFEAEQTGDKGLRDRSNVLTPGFPSLVAFDGQLMTIYGDGRIFKRHLSTGEVINTGQTPFRGAYQVSGESVFILNQSTCEFAEYNHRLMKEVSRQGLRQEMQQLFQGRLPTINALLVSEDSILWTTMYGMLMGLERHAKPGRRRIGWVDSLEGAVMPIGVPPKATAEYMYYSAISIKSEVRKGLVCYQSSAD